MKVLVTGGCGFIGSHIVDELINKKYEVAVADMKINRKNNKPAVPYANSKAEYLFCDIRNWSRVKKLFEKFRPDFVIHCAALARIQPSLKNPMATYKTNVLGTLNILQASRLFKVKKVVYSASSSSYAGHTALPLVENMPPLPLNPYAFSKLMGEMVIEQYVQNFGVKACSLKYFNVYGPRQPEEGQYATVIGIFLRQYQNNKPMTIVPDGEQKRDFTWVGDVVKANILAMHADNVVSGETMNIGSGENYSMFEVADFIGGKEHPRVFIEPRTSEARETLADISKAKKLLNWEPEISLKQGIEILKTG